ncbi:MAG: SDR family NAD(P)-dependent oxidoreductase [Acidimicrobiia bacterium]
MLLDGQRAIVTGGGSGIGAATCRRFAEEGAKVAVLDIDGGSAAAVAAEVEGVSIAVDVADTEALAEAFGSAASQLGGLTTVFNNAGVGALKPLHEYGDDEWRHLIDVNMTAVFAGIRAAVPLLRESGGGSIVNCASQSAARPTRGESPYSAAKAGAVALTHSAALEYGRDGIRVNAVLPGFIETPLTALAANEPSLAGPIEEATPLRRIGTATEVADCVVFLCSEMASYVTGHCLMVDGGSYWPNAQVDGLFKTLLGD